MSRKSALSIGEKREKMIEFFFEKKDFFTLKELERLCHKEKGIPSMTVKEVLMSLVFDGMVDSDKIGTSVYFWAFPSKAFQNRLRKIQELEVEVSNLESRHKELQDALSEASIKKKDTAERMDALSVLSKNQVLVENLRNECRNLQNYHPDRLQSLKLQTETATECANRWTDNVFQLVSWIKNKFAVEEGVLSKQFQIPDNLDYIDC